MNSPKINVLGLENVSIDEAITIDGGAFIPWGPIIDYLIRTVSGFLLGWEAYRILNKSDVEEYYGGELEPAICIG